MELIFDIKRFSINDGPGIRTTVFIKGCPLKCVWCHNPEGISPHPQKLYTSKKCIGCKSCVEACPESLLSLTKDGITGYNDERCLQCGKCTEACPTKALEMSGRGWTMEHLMEVMEKERKVMEDSGGGVTLCGGEPLMHPAYTLSILQELGRRGFHRTVDTTLYASESTIRETAQNAELFLVDLKVMDSEKHRLYTGVSNNQILSNYRLLSQLLADKGNADETHGYWVRIPLIETVNTDEKNIEAAAKFLSGLPLRPHHVNLLSYHDIGKGKHARLGTTYNPQGYPFATPSEETLNRCKSQIESAGLTAILGG